MNENAFSQNILFGKIVTGETYYILNKNFFTKSIDFFAAIKQLDSKTSTPLSSSVSVIDLIDIKGILFT